MKNISLKDLLEAGCHFGHRVARWNPKMRAYIYMVRDGIHIFDLAKTKEGLEAAAAFAKDTASQGGEILFVGTKRQAQEIIVDAAKKAGMPFMTTRWIGGLITNWEMVSKRIEHLRDLKAGVAENRFRDRTKKERLLIDREIIKMEKDFGGVFELRQLPKAVFVIDAKKEIGVIREASHRGIKVVAICDTNADHDLVDFVIPANDDAIKSIQLITDMIVEAIGEGASVKALAPEGKEKEEKTVEKPRAKKVRVVKKVKKA